MNHPFTNNSFIHLPILFARALLGTQQPCIDVKLIEETTATACLDFMKIQNRKTTTTRVTQYLYFTKKGTDKKLRRRVRSERLRTQETCSFPLISFYRIKINTYDDPERFYTYGKPTVPRFMTEKTPHTHT